MVQGEQSAIPPENQLHPDTAGKFRKRGGSLSPEENFNPTNVQVEKSVRSSGQRKRKKVGFLRNSSEDGEQDVTQPAVRRHAMFDNESKKPTKEVPDDINGGSWIEKKGYALGRAVVMTSAYAWTSFIYFTFQIWLGVIATVAIGLVFAIEFYVGGGITQTAFDLMMASIGVNWDFYLVATLFYLLLVSTGYIQLIGVAMQAKSLGLHPLGGQGEFYKTGTFLLCFILYVVPIFNCLPLVTLYIATIQAYPR